MTNVATPSPNRRYVSFRDLRAYYGIDFNRATIRNMMNAGEFPAATMIGGRTWAWPQQTILDWIASKPIRVPEPQKASVRKAAKRAEKREAKATPQPQPNVIDRPRARFNAKEV